jgi:DNA-binding CsgD family transcriptional regulator
MSPPERRALHRHERIRSRKQRRATGHRGALPRAPSRGCSALPLAPARPRRGRGRDATGLPLRSPRAPERRGTAGTARVVARRCAPRVLCPLSTAHGSPRAERRPGELATVWDEVGRMPMAQREAFLLREIRGLSYGQLADELSLSSPSVRSLLTRARARLRHRLRDVTAGFSTAPWVQPLVRVVAGGDGTSPLPAATKAAAIGVGTLALVTGGNLSPGAHRPPRTPGPVAHPAHALVPHPAKPTGLAVAATGADHTPDARRSEPEPEHSQRGGDRSSGSHDGSGDTSSSDGGSAGTRHDGSDGTTVVAQPTTDGGGSSSTSGRDGSHDGSSGSGSSGPGSGSDSGTTTTVTTSVSDGSDGSDSSGGDSGHGG